MRTNHDDKEALQAFFERMDDLPRLSATEEAASEERLATSNRRLRGCLLSCDFMLDHVACLFERLRRREIRLDHVIGFSSSDAAERRRVEALLPIALEELRRALYDNRRAFGQVMKRNRPLDERRAVWRGMGKNRAPAIAAVNQIGIRTRQLQQWQRQLEAVGLEMGRLTRQLESLRQTEHSEQFSTARRELSGLGWRTHHGPLTLARHLARCQRCEREYGNARHVLVLSNLRLVVAAAKCYRHQGVSFLDLIQEGNAGLLHAVDRWSPKGGKFTTYATWWIKQAIRDAVRVQPRTIRLPEQLAARLQRVQRAVRSLEQQSGLRPELTAIAEKVGISAEQVARALRSDIKPFSLDQPLAGCKVSTIGDSVADDRQGAAPQELTREHLKERLAHVMTELNDRQRTVISLRYGLLDGSQRTFEEVGKLLSLTREGVRQIEIRALDRLRRPPCSRLLREFTDAADSS